MANPVRHNYLQFTRKEKTGILCLIFLISLFILVPFIYPFIFKAEPVKPDKYQSEIDSLQVQPSRFSNYKSSYGNSKVPVFNNKFSDDPDIHERRFYFDPNTIGITEWTELGVREKTAEGIRHYIEKGGRFKEPADLNKIWGINDKQKAELLPYVKIIAHVETAVNYNGGVPKETVLKHYERRSYTFIDVNTADTAEFIALPGIGSKLANRICTFRDRLGGFSSIDQISETFGLADSTFQMIKQYLKFSGIAVRKLKINSATVDELKSHPYVRWQLANLIVNYRNQHGRFDSINDLESIALITPEILTKLKPYLSAD